MSINTEKNQYQLPDKGGDSNKWSDLDSDKNEKMKAPSPDSPSTFEKAEDKKWIEFDAYYNSLKAKELRVLLKEHNLSSGG